MTDDCLLINMLSQNMPLDECGSMVAHWSVLMIFENEHFHKRRGKSVKALQPQPKHPWLHRCHRLIQSSTTFILLASTPSLLPKWFFYRSNGLPALETESVFLVSGWINCLPIHYASFEISLLVIIFVIWCILHSVHTPFKINSVNVCHQVWHSHHKRVAYS